ncbi:MAG TPA: AMMECR1 domain-containing protein [Blastocatellia bacterium]|nr:AMMECR1 domain-containing protein [Blastocatellia bacterium]
MQLLLRDGILYRSSTQPILSRDGSSARWMLNSLAVTLLPRGAELAGRCILDLLKRYDGRQIATYGLTGVPILQSCILQSGGVYGGLLIRKERKKHGSLKLIEGKIDPAQPVILIDDSISSGTSMNEGIERLEEAGLRVEGAICLVRFGWYGGFARLQERGYHVESVYDIYDDFMSRMPDESGPLRNPTKVFPDFEWSAKRAPEGLHPARLARYMIAKYIRSGKLPRPPERLDAGYDSSGGAWVSVRSQDDVYLRHARQGFWHFPWEQPWRPAEDIARAALLTAVDLRGSEAALDILGKSNIAVTLFGRLEECSVGQLDNDRYGIVVCSRERPSTMGGALPRMPGISNEWEQFRHARTNNARLVSFEPFTIYRHDVRKLIEPGARWQPTGVPKAESVGWHDDGVVCGKIAARARDIAVSRLCGTPEATGGLADCPALPGLDSVYVSVYIGGGLRGCMGSVVRNLDDTVRKLTLAALEDKRFQREALSVEPGQVAVSVSLLYNPLELGAFSAEEVVLRVRHGEQALMVYQGDRVGLLLPFVATTNNLNREAFAEEVIDKAGITRPPYRWCRFECSSWLAGPRGTSRLEGGFPAPPPADSLRDQLSRLADRHCDYLLRQQKPDGTFYLRYEPFQNRLYDGTSLPWLAHAAWVLARAHNMLGGNKLRSASNKAISYLLNTAVTAEDGLWLQGKDASTIAELSFLLLALCERSKSRPRTDHARALAASQIAETLWSAVDNHGLIATHRLPTESPDAYQDYFPGQALLALAAAGQARGEVADGRLEKLYRAFRYYRHRFRYKRHFGQVSWLMQAFALWWQVTGDRLFADLVFEIGDWITLYQVEKTGAFINDHQSDTPGYTTALYLEGITSALGVTALNGDRERYDRYLNCCARAYRFLDRLVIQERDSAILPNPEFAYGGLRQSIHRSEVRIDFVQHSLSSVLSLYPMVIRDDLG